MNSQALIKYPIEILRQIRQNALLNYTNFHLNSITRSHIISLGIRKQPLLCKYCRTRAGKQLFHKINTLASRWQNWDKRYCIQQSRRKSGITIDNLIRINSTLIQPKSVHLTTINTRSIWNKIDQFQHYLLKNNIDICAVTETWLKEDDEYELHEIPPPGFKIISKPRSDGRQGGGIALIYKENYAINDHKINTNSQCMELSAFDLCIQDRVIDLLVIYRHPNTSVVSFCNDLADILGNNILTLKGHCILTGDFNIHIDDTSDNNTKTLNDMLDSLGMINHITFPTQKQGHTLNLFIEEGNSPLITKVTRGHLISDHHFIHAHLNICKNKP